MEWNERMATARKAAGLTQEQLGERAGVTRQAVSKWESGQSVPDAVTLGVLCQELHVSADYILSGKEPADAPQSLPGTCPCCGKAVSGSVCVSCGYSLPAGPSRGPRYALLLNSPDLYGKRSKRELLEQYAGLTAEEADTLLESLAESHGWAMLRRELPDQAAVWLASHLNGSLFRLQIVEDAGEAESALTEKPSAMPLPAPADPKSDRLGFWGIVLAVIVALVILSFL